MFNKNSLIKKSKRDVISLDYVNSYSRPSRRKRNRITLTLLKWLTMGGILAMSAFYVAKTHASNASQYYTLDDVKTGQLLLASSERLKTNKGEKKLYQPALLVDSSATFDINGIIATVTLTQSFLNNGNTVVNGLYTFPLPENSAVNFLKIQIGDRTIEGKITEKNEAKKLFNQAKKQGKKASLVEQHRPNLFTNSIANIAPKEQVTVTIKYVQHVAYDKGQFSLRFPMTITPRYSPLSNVNMATVKNTEIKNTEIKNNDGTDQPIDLELRSDNQHSAEQTNSSTNITHINNNNLVSYLSHLASLQTNNIQLNVDINAGVPLNTITSPSHKLTIKPSLNNSNHYDVSVGHVQVPMDKDFVLQWRPVPKTTPQLSIVHQILDNETYALAMIIPPITNANSKHKFDSPSNNQTFPRDVTFIIDTSGSMQGSSIQQAKQSLRFALNTLTPKDSFNIIAFESSPTNLFNLTVMATPANLTKARAFIASLSADGGTEMLSPLTNALSMPQAPLQTSEAIKQILFITDGAVSNEQALFKLISDTQDLPRLFTVGIGSAPNGYFMRKAAQFGQGSYTYIGNVNEVAEKMSNLLSKISRPALKNIQVKFHPLHVGSLEQYPNKIPDLYENEPLIIAFKTSVMPSSIQLFGDLAHQPWQEKIDLAPQGNNNANSQPNALITSNTKGITSIWARAKIEDLMDSMIKGKPLNEVKPLVISTSINHQIMSPYTSFLAIETETTPLLDMELTEVSRLKKLQLAKQQAMTATPFPKTAVGWYGQLLMGLLLLIVSGFTWVYAQKSTIRKSHFND